MKKDWWKSDRFMAPALLIAFVGSVIFLMLTFGRGCQNVVHSFTEGVAATEKGKEINNQLKPCPKCGATKYSVYRKTKDGKDVSENTDEKDMLVKIACCNGCFIATEYKSSVKEAIDAWNKREVHCLLSEEDLNNHNIGFAIFWGFLLFLIAIVDWLNFGAPHAFEDFRADLPITVFLLHFSIVGLTVLTAVKFVHYVIEVWK